MIAEPTIRQPEASTSSYITAVQYAERLVPPGGTPFAPSIPDEPAVASYDRELRSGTGDVGVVALDAGGERIGCVSAHRVEGVVEHETPELEIAAVEQVRQVDRPGGGTALLCDLLCRTSTLSLGVDRTEPGRRLDARLGFQVAAHLGEGAPMSRRSS